MGLTLSGDKQRCYDTQTRAYINRELQVRFAPEDDVLRNSITRAQAENIPAMQISPLQGKLLQVLALANGTRTMLEIGTMIGYSGVWLARGLPPDGKLISLEVNPRYAEIARATFAEAGLSDRTEVLTGPALDLLPTLVPFAPFDMIFIDADKRNNPQYLDWALQLSRIGSLIIADNIVRGGHALQTPPPDESAAGAAAYTYKIDESAAGAAAYIYKILEDPRLVSVALTNDDAINGIDGFAISIVKKVEYLR